MKNFYSFFIFIISFIFLICIIAIISIYYNQSTTSHIWDNNYYFSNSEYFWPTPGFHNITSHFGTRISPTTGASTNHSGIDIGAQEGSFVFSILSGKVVYTGFYGANGHSVIIKTNDIDIQYSHLSSNYIVHVGEIVNQGQIIGSIGPKYITDIVNNPYKDSSGKPTNGATTGPHLHLTIKEKGSLMNPLNLFY